ncbi:MAG: filamentous hemagglutinin N-terminal domain-containing protein [Cyanobacteria bacterium P01_A01_bin.84]
MKISRYCFQKLAFAIFTTIVFYTNSVSAQIVKDATLPSNSSLKIQENIKVIEGGTQAGNNLFHSFEQFGVPTGSIAYFNNAANIQNIITRITGKSISHIDGILRTNGKANLFLINPNGIIFGKNASLDIGGSFLATTASSINFADGTKFSATHPQTTPLLTINLPIGLQFASTAAPIRNQSQASVEGVTNFFSQPVGLRVYTGKTLALIGGDVILEGGNLTAESGQIRLVAVAGNSLVSLKSINQDWTLGYEGVENFQNIQLIGQNIDNSVIGSMVDVSGENGGGNILLQGNSVELIGSRVRLINATKGLTDAGDLTINARQVMIRDGAQVLANTYGGGAAGDLTVNASDFIELTGGAFSEQNGNNYFPSTLASATLAGGNGGNVTVNTSRLLISDGAGVSLDTSGRLDNSNKQLILSAGKGGNLTVNASKLVELIGIGRSAQDIISFLASRTINSKNAGNLTISTKRLIVRDGAEISVSSQFPESTTNSTVVGDTSNLGDAGEVNIITDSILLDNQGKLISETESGNGGNINLQLKDLLLMRRNSQISTNAGKAQLNGDGGNIIINIPNGFIVASPNENSDITANAFTDRGGIVNINANTIFGIQPRSRDSLANFLSTNEPRELNPQSLLTSDITAISQQNPNLNGEVNINTLNLEPEKGLIELPDIPLSTQISQVCKHRSKKNQSEFIFTGRGGLPAYPGEALRNDSALDVDWVSLGEEGRISTQDKYKIQNTKTRNQIVEATGWMVDKNGDIVLTVVKPKSKISNSNNASC